MSRRVLLSMLQLLVAAALRPRLQCNCSMFDTMLKILSYSQPELIKIVLVMDLGD